MVVEVKISSPSRAISLSLDTSSNQAILNGQKIDIDTAFYAGRIAEIAATIPFHLPMIGTDTESYVIKIDNKKLEGWGHSNGYDKLLALIYSLN